MTEPTQAVKSEMDFIYQVDQQVSVNAFIDIDINGEPVRFQITNRYNSSAEKIVKTTTAAIEAFAALRAQYPRSVQIPQPKPAEHKQEFKEAWPAVVRGAARSSRPEPSRSAPAGQAEWLKP